VKRQLRRGAVPASRGSCAPSGFAFIDNVSITAASGGDLLSLIYPAITS
jgi:hypothetical protein